MDARVKKVLRRAHWKGTRAIGATKLFTGVGSGRVRELWIGDSHAVLLNTAQFPLFMESIDEGRFIWHLGPRIIHSIAAKGFPSVVVEHSRRLGRLRKARDLTVFFVFGEIDVRCHLAPRLAEGIDPGFVADYVQRAIALADSIGAARIVIVTPTPPGDDIEDHVMFPIAGDITERTAAHRWLCDALIAAVPAGDPRVSVLDLREALTDGSGRLPSELTYDGCHTNDAGRAAVRRLVLEHLTTPPTATQETPR